MLEFRPIIDHITRHIELSDNEQKTLVSFLRRRLIKKKQLIAQPEFICKYRSYVVNGAMRAYLLDHDKGSEHTIALAIEDWWISDYNSFIFQQPATLFVEALEDTVVIEIDYDNEQLLKDMIPKFEKFFRISAERSFAFLQRRMLTNLCMTAEQRYENFISHYPQLAQRVPQYALASFLGMSTEYLSKLRNDRVVKKS